MKFYFKFKIIIDLFISFFLVSFPIFIGRNYFSLFYFPQGERYYDLLEVVFSCSVTLVGFVLASIALMFGYDSSKSMAFLKASKGFRQIVSIIATSVYGLVGLACVSFLSMFVPSQFHVRSFAAVSFILIFTFLSFSALLWSVVKMMSLSLRNGADQVN